MPRYRLAIALYALVVLATSDRAMAAADNIPTLRAHVIEWYAKGAPEAERVERFVRSLRPDGSWPDVDYASTDPGGWLTYRHVARTLDMARAYRKPNHPWAGRPELRDAIVNALAHWTERDYQNTNWWYMRIGIPDVVAPTLVLMGDAVPAALRDKTVRQVLGRSTMGMTGQNKVWLAGIALMKGLLADDAERIAAARDQIFAELHVTTAEGIQSDYSFHQHGPQQQWGNYGAAFSGDMLRWAGIFHGTDYALTPAQTDLLGRYLLDGTSWVLWHGRMDISGCGRQIFKRCQASKGASIIRQLKSLESLGWPETEAFRRIMASNTPEGPNTFVGSKHFWRSDMTVHRRPRWYASVKMSSTRVIGAETCNSENLRGLHLGDGVTYFLRSGAEYDDLFPVWDWRRLPGTTCRQDNGSLVPDSRRCRGRSDFVGGLSDGTRSIATMEYLRDGLAVRKAWFFLDDAVVCLGAGITGEPGAPVLTSVNQCHFRATAAVSRGRGVTLLGQAGRSTGPLKWVHHDGIGYVFPGAQAVTASVENQRGDWQRVHSRYSTSPVQQNVFNLGIDHGTQPQGAGYAYMIFPDVTRDEMPALCEAPPVKVLQQSASLLAVSSENGRLVQAVFFEPGRLACDDDLLLEVDAPCVVMLDRTASPMRLHLADPTHKRKEITVQVAGRQVTVDLPRDGLAGRTVSLELGLQK